MNIEEKIDSLQQIVLSGFTTVTESIALLSRDLQTLNIKVGKLDKKIDAVEESLKRKIDTVEERLSKRIDAAETKLNKKIDTFYKDLDEKIDTLYIHTEQSLKSVNNKVAKLYLPIRKSSKPA